MIAYAKMTKNVPIEGQLIGDTKDLFKRHKKKVDFRGVMTIKKKDPCSLLLDIADTPSLQEKGLMGRVYIPRGYGMLFTDIVKGGHFWMYGCKTAMDIIFIKKDNTISHIFTMEPDGGVKRYPSYDSKIAVEVQAGFCKSEGIKPGMKCTWRKFK